MDGDPVEGRVVDRIAQQVTREGGVTRITLSALPGQPFPSGRVALPEPVRLEAGEKIIMELGWIPEPGDPPMALTVGDDLFVSALILPEEAGRG